MKKVRCKNFKLCKFKRCEHIKPHKPFRCFEKLDMKLKEKCNEIEVYCSMGGMIKCE